MDDLAIDEKCAASNMEPDKSKYDANFSKLLYVYGVTSRRELVVYLLLKYARKLLADLNNPTGVLQDMLNYFANTQSQLNKLRNSSVDDYSDIFDDEEPDEDLEYDDSEDESLWDDDEDYESEDEDYEADSSDTLSQQSLLERLGLLGQSPDLKNQSLEADLNSDEDDDYDDFDEDYD